MIIKEWPAMIAVTADRVAPGDVMYGHEINDGLALFDEAFTVTDVQLAPTPDYWRITGHESDGIPGFYLRATSDYVIIGKGKS